MKQDADRSFQLVRLDHREDVLQRLRNAEKELSGLLGKDVALIAWSKTSSS
ncbi:hypothetical protein [Staphylospora marina]|uniref:hypothetical protein n=1 Tax=Staphylospora marina TaxID=2490858 RepID=UPI0013DDCB1B|nr:hypothetical protein [Staphylospora marina]